MASISEHKRKDGRIAYRVRFRWHGSETSETFYVLKEAQQFISDIDNRGIDHAMRVRLALLDDRSRERGTTLNELFDDFAAWKTHRVRSDRTIKDYRTQWRRYIAPTLGTTPAAMLTQPDVTDWVDALTSGKLQPRVRIINGTRTTEPISPKSIADHHALLHAVVKHAIKKGIITADPCDQTELPKRRKGQPKGLRPGEWQALQAALRQVNPDACDLAEFLLATGWRWGEATALSTYDVEDDGVNVWVTVTQVMRRGATGRPVIVQDAKSDAGLDRRIRLDREASHMVRRRVSLTTPGALVFTTASGAAWHHSHFRNRYWAPALDVANLHRRPTPHWLRHTHVAWMLMTKQANLPELQARIGHASIKTTVDVYGRMVSDVDDEALDAFSAMRAAAPRTIQSVTDPNVIEPPATGIGEPQ